MNMPFRCFACASYRHDCGHREPELVEHYLGEDNIARERLKIARQELSSLEYRIRQGKKLQLRFEEAA